jgi:hypothetical protein
MKPAWELPNCSGGAGRAVAFALALLFSAGIAVAAENDQRQPAAATTTSALPSLDEALNSREDLWGLAAMHQANGPSYEFFKDLLPPLRYVNAAFRHYPIILSAPGAAEKVRLISNGNAVNARAVLTTWKEMGIPITFCVGNGTNGFGENLRRLQGPVYAEGCLPIVQLSYEQDAAVYEEETFARVDTDAGKYGVGFTQFKLKQGRNGIVSARIDYKSALTITNGVVCNTNGEVLVRFDKKWKWDGGRQALVTSLRNGKTAALMIAAKPIPMEALRKLSCDPNDYTRQRKLCVATWQRFLAKGMQLELPETVVNNAWRSLIVGNYLLVQDDLPNYGWGTLYQRIYEAESGDAARSMLLYGYTNDVRLMMPSLLDYSLDKLAFHNAGFKLQALAHYYWITRDAAFVNSTREKWSRDVKLIAEGRDLQSGLAPRENYCGDIFQSIDSLNSNSSAWRGLRDIAAVMEDIGEQDEAKKLNGIAVDYRKRIIEAVEKSERNDVTPHFIPIALFGAEKPYDPLTGSKLGSYWNLLAPYLLGSEVFGAESDRERSIVDYIQEKGGVFMGMIRFDQHSGLFANENSVDDLYGLRYVTTLLRLDQSERALVSFYGKLAQGMTRDTFIGGEGTGLKPLDGFGRPMYLPPNSSANAHFLWTLRYLLVQDWDMDDDGKPETLRLLFATSRRWLEDGKCISIKNAPTAFGPISVLVQSRLNHGEVLAELELPNRPMPKQTLLRIRVPEGWKVVSGKARKEDLKIDDNGTSDISKLKGRTTILFQVKKMIK